jgi:hypothetical protein
MGKLSITGCITSITGREVLLAGAAGGCREVEKNVKSCREKNKKQTLEEMERSL